jgi:hypothetical protein
LWRRSLDDAQVRMKLVDILGNLIPNRVDAIMGSDKQQGTAQYSPYMAPFSIIVSRLSFY